MGFVACLLKCTIASQRAKLRRRKLCARLQKNEKGSPLVPEHLPIWKYASGDLASRNDAQQSKKAKKRQVTNSDALLVLLRKLKL